VELLALVKHDCPCATSCCPRSDAAGVRVVSQSGAADTAAQAERVGIGSVPELDEDLVLSARFDPDAVPAVLLLDGAGEEHGRVEGLSTARLADLAAEAGVALDLAGLPEHRPGCASRTRDPDVAGRLAARRARADGRIRSRSLTVGGLEDPIEALHDRGLTDGLPVVPPTPERVVALLEGTSRDPQDLVGEVPPYGGRRPSRRWRQRGHGRLPARAPAGRARRRRGRLRRGVRAARPARHDAPGRAARRGLRAVAARSAWRAAATCSGRATGEPRSAARCSSSCATSAAAGRPRGPRAHGQPGKVGACFAERLDDTAPWPGSPRTAACPTARPA
jgi:hypothetical protein